MQSYLKTILLALLTTLLIVYNPDFKISLFQPHLEIFTTTAQAQDTQPNPQILLEEGHKLYETGQLSDAVTVLEKAVTIFHSQGEKLGEAAALSNLSLVLKKLGQTEKAENKITISLNILAEIDSKSQNSSTQKILAESQEIQGQIQLELGKTEQAINTWKISANTYKSIKDQLGLTRSLINQSIAQQNLGLYHQSRATLEQISPLLQKQPDSIVKATALRSLGDIFQLVGDLDKSQEILQQSLDIAKKFKSPSEISATLISLGNNQMALGRRDNLPQNQIDYEQSTALTCAMNQTITQSSETNKFYYLATELYSKAASQSPSETLKTQAQINQINGLQNLHKLSEAEKISREIRTKINKIPVNQATIFAQINLAQNSICWKKSLNPNILTWKEIAQDLATAIQKARKIHDQRSEAYALGVLGGVYLEIKDILNAKKLTEQAAILAQRINATDITYLWQWQLGYILNLKGDKKNAINSYIEAVNTLKSLRKDLVALNSDVQFSFRDNVEPVYRQFIDLLLQTENKNNQNSQISQNNLLLAREALESLQLTELENFFKVSCLLPKPKQIDEIVDKADLTAAVIYPIILKDRLEIILKLPNQSQLRHHTIYEKTDKIEKTLEQLQRYLREPDRINNVKSLSIQLYQWLISPLEKDLINQPIKTLVFVLDGSLRNIPMGVIYDDKNHQYLIQKYAIALAPGLQLIESTALERKTLDVLAVGISKQREIGGRKFAELKNVATELQQIKKMISSSKELIDQNFTKKNIQTQIQQIPYTVVHIASHGEFSSNADKTFILSWEELLKVRDFDQLLRLRSQSESRAVELLVLSACQTASGDKRAALGLAGIAVKAGTRSTVATLWSVDDESTTEFMIRFYQELANMKLNKSEALRRAQIAILDKYKTPFYWAPYVLVGNWL
jgi:CHAT domain-containing protein/tetratricopeptide (TPR) repeat protein